jgi:hypothetical protein
MRFRADQTASPRDTSIILTDEARCGNPTTNPVYYDDYRQKGNQSTVSNYQALVD